jgi:hypothetical protein
LLDGNGGNRLNVAVEIEVVGQALAVAFVVDQQLDPLYSFFGGILVKPKPVSIIFVVTSVLVVLDAIARVAFGFVDGDPRVSSVSESFCGGWANVDDLDIPELIGSEIRFGPEVKVKLS